MIAGLFSARGQYNRSQFVSSFGIAAICEGFPALGSSDLATRFDKADLYLVLALITAPFAWVQVCAFVKRLQNLGWHWILAVPAGVACFWPLRQIVSLDLPPGWGRCVSALAAYSVILSILLAAIPGRREQVPAVVPSAVVPHEESNGVIGWLVVIDGPLRGRHYRLNPRQNRIGSDPVLEVSLPAAGVAGEHAAITFDSRNFLYSLAPVGGTVFAGKNSNMHQVSGSSVLCPYDRIGIGETTLIFVPLHGF